MIDIVLGTSIRPADYGDDDDNDDEDETTLTRGCAAGTPGRGRFAAHQLIDCFSMLSALGRAIFQPLARVRSLPRRRRRPSSCLFRPPRWKKKKCLIFITINPITVNNNNNVLLFVKRILYTRGFRNTMG